LKACSDRVIASAVAEAHASYLKARDVSLPNSLPRPAHELEQLRSAWRTPSGLRFLTVVNNSYIGVFYVAAAFLFFLLAGFLALLMRTQLAVPDNTLVGPTLYSQLFTMHGTTMMFLFAVPAVEAMAVLLLPNMLLAHYTVAQGAVGLAVVHGFPRLVA
jgi:cytochrome c oxidase subunit I+III